MAFEQFAAEGYLEARRGSGTFVSATLMLRLRPGFGSARWKRSTYETKIQAAVGIRRILVNTTDQATRATRSISTR